MKQKLTKEERELIKAHNVRMRQRQLESGLKESFTRARSFTVGTAFGGAIEVSMRGDGGSSTWAILQPVEAIEVIHQLAAAAGCHIQLQPRNDFASWREWKYTPEEIAHYRGPQHLPGVGHAPHAKAIADTDFSVSLPSPEQQPGMPAPTLEGSNEETVATKTSE